MCILRAIGFFIWDGILATVRSMVLNAERFKLVTIEWVLYASIRALASILIPISLSIITRSV